MTAANIDTAEALTGQVAVITGAGRGIGAAISVKLSSLGATVVLCGRTATTLEATAKSIASAGGRAEVIVCDVSELESVEAAGRKIQSTLGRVDILVNNAGIGGFRDPLHQLSPESWDKILNTNLRGVYYMIRAFAPIMIAARSGTSLTFHRLPEKTPCPMEPHMPRRNGA